MLRIRLTRCGRKKRPFYRLVVANKDAPIKGNFVEALGYYDSVIVPKKMEFNQERIEYWISKGAQLSPTVASLCKELGMKNLENFMTKPAKKATKKKDKAKTKA